MGLVCNLEFRFFSRKLLIRHLKDSTKLVDLVLFIEFFDTIPFPTFRNIVILGSKILKILSGSAL